MYRFNDLYLVSKLYFQERLHLSPDKVAEINKRSPEQKWTLILAQVR